MSKQKKKSKPFDNSFSCITIIKNRLRWQKEICCPDCKTNLIFLYSRKRTKDEIWMCQTCETVLIVKMEIKIHIKTLKK